MTGGSAGQSRQSVVGPISEEGDGERWIRALPGLVGVALIVLALVHLWTHLQSGHGGVLSGAVEVGVPVSLGTALVAFGLWNRDQPITARQSGALFAWTVLGGFMFVGLAAWLVFIAELGGDPTAEVGYLLLNAAAVGASGNAVFGALFVRFRTERQRLDRTARELRERNERLDRFASMVTHDLRNPLSVAKGRTQLAYEEPDEASEHLGPALEALARIDARVDDLLALARGDELGRAEVVSLAAAVDAAWESVGTDRATLEVGDGPVESSERLLVQALENLLENAVVHGGEDVTVRVESLADGGFRVADDGPGIPEAEREAVLEPGVSGRDDGRGHGEGLAIVGTIAAAHGWRLVVGESETGGACFEFHPEPEPRQRVPDGRGAVVAGR